MANLIEILGAEIIDEKTSIVTLTIGGHKMIASLDKPDELVEAGYDVVQLYIGFISGVIDAGEIDEENSNIISMKSYRARKALLT